MKNGSIISSRYIVHRGRRAVAHIRSSETLHSRLQEAKTHPVTEVTGTPERWQHYVRLHFRPHEVFGPSDITMFKDERALRARAASGHWDFFITPYATEAGTGAFVDAFEDPQVREEREGHTLAALARYVRQCYGHLARFDEGLFASFADEHLTEILRRSLLRFLRSNLSARITTASSHSDVTTSLLFSRQDRTTWSRSIAWQLRKSNLPASRQWESECLRKEVRSARRGMILVSNCDIVIEDMNHRTIAEFDGVFLRILKGAVELVLIEAKTGHTQGSDAAVNQLRTTLLSLGGTEEEVDAVLTKKNKYAVARIQLKLGRRWNTREEATS